MPIAFSAAMTSSSASLITVALGSFDDLLARGLRGLIEDDPSLELVAADIAPARLSTTLRAHTPRVVILDAASPRTSAGLSHPATHVLLLADEPSSIECAQLLA